MNCLILRNWKFSRKNVNKLATTQFTVSQDSEYISFIEVGGTKMKWALNENIHLVRKWLLYQYSLLAPSNCKKRGKMGIIHNMSRSAFLFVVLIRIISSKERKKYIVPAKVSEGCWHKHVNCNSQLYYPIAYHNVMHKKVSLWSSDKWRCQPLSW